ncbi:PepSY domain-containing protein [Roseibium salinum]|uniref:PepSY domain-containing protein n=1 Tax=Roseibium salinum TaxID=1604349 RepID=A0ABT3R7A8_9HYPH|nr:PepSY domain-containing protein [Roseibium sp. DSM 29163]MCX2725181.1 PepSY domain-containing protein [Roseibium sp. DSM 29163]
MSKQLFVALALVLTPAAANALPAVGDIVGTNPTDATAALEQAGCSVRSFEAEDGKIEAKCTDAEKKAWEVYIDPKSGKVTNIKADD